MKHHRAVLGVILFFGGVELAAGLNGEAFTRRERVVMVVTAGIAPWNGGSSTSMLE